jgi:hypothetical protein
MESNKQELLVDEIMQNQPSLAKFLVDDHHVSLMSGSWDLYSYSFQKGFEAMWDLAATDQSGLLERPLLNLWRHSIELALKSTIREITEGSKEETVHNLNNLFQRLHDLAQEAGLDLSDDLTRDVKEMIGTAQSFDPRADRFRYPANAKGKTYQGINVDLDKLFQSHWIIVTWCEGVVVELREEFGVGHPE